MPEPTPEHDASSIREAGDRVRDDLEALREVLGQRAGALYEGGRRWVDAHPVAAMGLAFGLGYLLAGGLVSGPTLRLARLGARLYARRFVGVLMRRGVAELVALATAGLAAEAGQG